MESSISPLKAFLKDTNAVTEVVGEILMTALVVVAFSVIAMFVLSYEGPADPPHIDTTSWVDVESDNIYFRHSGGDPIDPDNMRIFINLNGTVFRLSPDDVQNMYSLDTWQLGDIISVNTLQQWGRAISEDSFVSANIVHTSSSSVIAGGILLGEEFSGGGYVTSPPAVHNQSYWRFDEGTGSNAYDSIGDNDGTVYGAAWITGINDTGLQFDGVNDRVRVPDAPSLNPSNEVTVEAWVKWSISPGDGDSHANIVNKGDSDSDTEYQLQHGNGNSKFEVAVRTDDRRRYVKSTTSPEVNEWYYVVGTYSSFDEELSIYVNGVKERSITHTGHIHISSDDLFIGERGDNSRYFTGVIDEVRISDRRLTDTQILARYELFNGSAPTLSGQTPSTPHSSNTTTSVTFSATSDQSSNNEFLLNGTHVSWSNGTSPSYANSSATVGTYNLTLIAHSSTKAALTDSMTWTWNVSEEGAGGQVSQWLLDENSGTNAYDSIGNNDGTIHGATWTTGISNSALSFDGLNDHVTINDSIIHDYPFTVVAWINTSASGKDQTIISLADSSVINSYYGIYIDHPRGIAIRARNTAVRTKYGSADVTDGQWHHVVGVFAAENDRKLYVDGVLNASTTIGLTFNSDVDRWNIGRWADSTPKSYFEGIIDEVHVNNTAWTADDVAS
ncbi:MAG: type IV pilin, partial [Methanosarcinaceae archaeon]|nr:type IV pilin [Methanosarcinaceae archaeon]